MTKTRGVTTVRGAVVLVACAALCGCCSKVVTESPERPLQLRLTMPRSRWHAGEQIHFECVVRSDSRYPLVFALPFGTGKMIENQPVFNLEIEGLEGQPLVMESDTKLQPNLSIWCHEFVSIDPGSEMPIYPREPTDISGRPVWEFPWLPSWRPAPGDYRARVVYDSSLPAKEWMYFASGGLPLEITAAMNASLKTRLTSDWVEFSVEK